ncbi:unnamed protein product [Pylaiella littoralis]
MKRSTSNPSSSCFSCGHDGDANGRYRCADSDDDDGYVSDRNFVLEQDNQSATTRTDSEPKSDDDERQDQDEHTGKIDYLSACTKLGIVPASNILTRLSSDCLSLRHALLNPASAAALSVGLSANRCIRSLNLGSNLLGDDSARPLLEAMSDNPSLTKLDLSRNLLSDRFGELLARSISSPLCALRDLVLAENFLTDSFTEALSKGMRDLAVLSSSPLRSLDVSSNKICDSDRNDALASILCNCPRLAGLNLSWNDLRTVSRSGRENDLKPDARKKTSERERAVPRGYPFASAALVYPGRLVSLELPFNGLADTFGVIVGSMLQSNSSLSVLDLSRNHLGKSSALSISGGLKNNRGLRTLKLGWNPLGREGTLSIILAVGDNRGPLQVVRLENTTDAGTEFEASRRAESIVAKRAQWVEVVCEYPDRDRTKGNSCAGPVSWMTEYPPDEDKNTAYKTRAEMEEDESLTGLLPTTHPTTNPTNTGARTSANARNAVRSSHSVTKLRALLPTNATPSSRSPRVARYADTSRKGSGGIDLGEEQRSPSYFGPTKEAVAVPVLAVRMELRAREKARLEAERQANIVEEQKAKKRPEISSYLRPLNKQVKEKSLAGPPPRLLLLRKLKASRHSSARLTGTGTRSASRGRRSTEDSGPGYMKTTGRSTGDPFGKSHQSARVRVQSADQVSRGRSKSRGRGAWGKKAGRACSTSQKRPGCGRSTSARRTRRGATRSRKTKQQQ